MALGLDTFAQLLVEKRHVDVEVGVEGIGRERASVMVQRPLILAALLEQVGEIEIGLDMLPVYLQAAFEAFARRFPLSLVVVDGSEVAVAILKLRLEPYPFQVALDGPLERFRIRIQPAALGEQILRRFGVDQATASIDRSHSLLARLFGAEIEYRLTIGFEQDPIVPDNDSIRAFHPEPQRTNGIIHLREALSQHLDIAPNSPQGNTLLEKRHDAA